MRTICAFIVLLIASYVNSVSQVIAFDKGKIITKNKDTLNVLVGLETTYYNKVSYKLSKNSEISYKKINEISYLITPFNTFQNVLVNKSEKLFRVAVSGQVSLLEYVEINQGLETNVYGGKMTSFSEPTIIYAVRTSSGDYIIKKKKEKSLILPLFECCPEIKSLVEDKSFKLEDLQVIITKLNNSSDQIKKTENSQISTSVQSPAIFGSNGNLQDFRNWVLSQIQIPQSALLDSLHGKIKVKFTIDKSGNVTNLKLLDSIRLDIDREILKVICSSPRWTPATQAGMHVNQTFTLPFLFDFSKIHNDNTTIK